MSDADWNDVISTNLTSCFHWTKHLARPMTRARWGRIVNITSVSGILGNAGQANYSAAKAGMIGLTKSLAREFASRSVTVNAVAPGFIKTDMTTEFVEQARGRGEDPRGRPAQALRRGRRHRQHVRLPLLRGGRIHYRSSFYR